MAASKKKVKVEKIPKDRYIGQGGDPDQFYRQKPSWNFSSCDKEKWSINEEDVHKIFWNEILTHLQNLETQKWSEILVRGNKQNHNIDTNALNKGAIDRLEYLNIEAEDLISLRITGTHRIYGYNIGSVFNIVWVDLDHGDNSTCVCRSHKKHT